MLPATTTTNKNLFKKLFKFLLLTFIVFSFFLLIYSVAQADSEIIINEILPNPSGRDSGREFIELYNPGSQDISLANWQVHKKARSGSVRTYYFSANEIIKAKEYFILTFNGLNNDGAEIEIVDDAGEKIDSMDYKNAPEGLSYNCSAEEQDFYLAEPTPAEKNKPDPRQRKYPKILINEIFPHPSADEKNKEFIELYNPNREEINLRGWALRDASRTGKYIFKKDKIIKSLDYLVVYRSDFKFALNNSGSENIFLLAPNDDFSQGEFKDKISYQNSFTNRSYNRDEKENDKWYWTEPSPNQENKPNPLRKKYPALFITEILPNPLSEEEKNEYIEIYNPQTSTVTLAGWALSDKTGQQYLFSKEEIKPQQYLVVYRSNFKFALNNSGSEEIKLLAPNQKVIHSLSYRQAPEGISYSFDLEKHAWHWTEFQTPGQANKFNQPLNFQVKLPRNIYQNVKAKFNLQDLQINSKKELKFKWDFGDGHHSYLQNPSHIYQQRGKFQLTVSIFNGRERKTKQFTVRVEKYPYRPIKIVEIMPNPIGKDTGHEYIVLENKSSKKINLADYFIATGKSRKKLVRHPIYKDFIIKSHHRRKLFNKKICKFSLPNTKGEARLLAPDGEIVDKVKYQKEKIADNEKYILATNKRWIWLKEKPTNLTATPAQALAKEKGSLDPTLNIFRRQCDARQQIIIYNWFYRLKTKQNKFQILLWQKIISSLFPAPNNKLPKTYFYQFSGALSR